MDFQAKLKGKDYLIRVDEQPKYWGITLQEKGQKEEFHKIPKEHFKRMDQGVSFLFDESSYMVDVVGEGTQYTVYTRGSYREIPLYNDESLLHESLKGGGAMGASDSLKSGMPGKIVDIMVAVGDNVEPGQPLLIMEAMKMENEMKATHPCVVKEILVNKGDSVESGALLIKFES
ncbi:MAG: acetyl-CoA carboxylase biotin carboxyl carrier protein subunit [Bdellovibrionota bacterium]